jgi:hypothetical protein
VVSTPSYSPGTTKNSRPDLERPAWGGLEMTVVDPVNNRIAFVASEAQA